MSLALQHSPARIIAGILVDRGLGTSPSSEAAWPAYASSEPNSPDNCLTVYDTTGLNDGRDGPTGVRTEHPGIQVRIRSTNERTGYRKAEAIADDLNQIVNQTVNLDSEVYLIQTVIRTGPVFALGTGRPPSKRHLFTINALVSVKRTT